MIILKNKKNKTIVLVVLIVIGLIILSGIIENANISNPNYRRYSDKYFEILSNEDNKAFEDELMAFAEDNDIYLSISYADDLEAIDKLESNSNNYDAVWMSNSTWLYMLDGVKTSNSKSININPVVFGIKKNKANELGFVDKDVYNKDIVKAIQDGKLKYVMSSVTKTNTGLIAYLGFLNSLAGSPEILTSDMLKSKTLEKDLKTLFSGVERVSGTDDFLKQMFLNTNEYEAVIATESSLIEINKELVSQNKEPLYLIYPLDGVAINDSPFAYIDNGQEKEEQFLKLQSFLLSSKSQKELENLGKRTWYGGTNLNADKNSFRKEWGIDTSKYLMTLKYPSKDVINEAIELYIDVFRKPAAVVFCLDTSGSMYGSGISSLKEAMSYILNYETASKDKIQFSEKDKIYVYAFSNEVEGPYFTENGKETSNLIDQINMLHPTGSTNLYGCATEGLWKLNSLDLKDDYTKTIILMTDGEANVGSFSSLKEAYRGSNIPIYSIMFGSARKNQLEEIANLSNAKVFDGRTDLTEAFKEVRSYN